MIEVKIDRNLLRLIRVLWGLVSASRKRQLFTLSLVMGASSIFEVISIGAVIPFLLALTDPDYIFRYLPSALLEAFDISSNKKSLAMLMALVFCISIALSGILRMAVVWAINKISYGLAADFGIKIYQNVLEMPYAYHLEENSSKLISGVSLKVDIVINQIIIPALLIASSASTLLVVLSTTAFYSPITFLILVTSAATFYFLISILVKNILYFNSILISKNSNQKIKILQESLGGIRDIIIGSYQTIYIKIFSKSDMAMRSAQASNQFISTFPRTILEVVGTIFIVATAYVINLNDSGMVGAIPILGMIALGAQRLLPIVQQLYNSWSVSAGAKETLGDVITLLEKSSVVLTHKQNYKNVPFHNKIILENIAFKYRNSEKFILKGASLEIIKGSKVGIIGATGTGKSTLMDLMMGLLNPTEGSIFIDNTPLSGDNMKDWQSKITHVPQNIYMSDQSILENIAFGIDKENIDYSKAREAAKIACIVDAIDGFEGGFNTIVGERASRLSGGQKQRIGIARALYKGDAEILFLDEATSALDLETELKIIDNIYRHRDNMTIVMISHRKESLKYCNYLVKLLDKGVVKLEVKRNE